MPGETYETLKEKFTKQQTKKAEQVGVSPQEAQNYGQRFGGAMAANAAIEGGSINVDKRGNIAQVQPDDFMSPYDDPSQARLPDDHPIHTYPSGRDKFLGVNDPELQKDVASVPQLQRNLASKYPSKEDTGLPLSTRGIFGIDFSNLSMPSFPSPMGMIMNVLQATQGKDKVFKKLARGKDLTPEDKVILANLIAANKENPAVLGDIDYEKYLTDGILDFDVKDVKGFDNRLEKEIGDLENTDYQSLIDQYETGQPTGVGGIFGLGEGERTGGITREELKKKLGKEGLAYLKANDPAKYYSFTQPQTTDSLEDLANLRTQGLEGTNPDLVKMILNARDESARQKGERTKYTGLGSYMGEEPVAGGAGIPSLATVPTPFTDINNNGILDNLEVAQATTTPGVPSLTPTSLTPTTIDYASMAPQFGSQYPGYKNQGVASPQLGDWYQNLNKYYT